MSHKPLLNRMVILGLGLIGGSLALAAKSRGLVKEVGAWGHREASLQTGMANGVIDDYALDIATAVKGADLIVIATPTQISENILLELSKLTLDDCVITDVASVKGNMLDAARRAFGKVPANLVLGHPIAGSEQSGVEAAVAELFVKHRIILTPTTETNCKALELVRYLWQGVGGEVVEMAVDDHDHVLAATSHLPHVLAYTMVDALVTMEGKREVFRFAAGGLRDFTRIASSSPQMWQEIVLANRPAILSSIDAFQAHLQVLRDAIEKEDAAAIIDTFDRAKKARDEFTALLQGRNQHLEP